MLIVIQANDEQKAELLLKNKNENVLIEYVNEDVDLPGFKNADAFFLLKNELNRNAIQQITQPVFIHSVVATLKDLNLPGNVSRINAWPTFLQRRLWEVATGNDAMVKHIFDQMGWKYLSIPDDPGLVAARIIAMIINEAYFTIEENISSKEHIDIAMKLGTNYPYGPFEWAKKIGLQHIHDLLKILEKNNAMYKVALALERESAHA